MLNTPCDQAIRGVALAQYGAFSSRQVHEHGGSWELIRSRVERHAWDRPEPGVYLLPGAPDIWRQRLWVALLVAGEGAVVSHRSAAALWGLPGFSEAPIEILAGHGLKNHRPPRGRFRESRALPASHTTTVWGIPVTTIERTLFDIAGTVDPRLADRAIEFALARRLTNRERLWAVWSEIAAPGRPGTRAMRKLLMKRAPGYVAKESELEIRFSELLEAAGIEQPEWQRDLGGEAWIGRVDAVFRKERLIVELDGRVGHDGFLNTIRDRERDNEFGALGFRTLRFTWEQLVTRPGWVIKTVRAALLAGA
jgi:very-short-patch-repair endonuclease